MEIVKFGQFHKVTNKGMPFSKLVIVLEGAIENVLNLFLNSFRKILINFILKVVKFLD